MPRNLTQPLAYFTKRLSYNVSTSGSGKVSIACCPSQCFNANPTTNLTSLLPFLSIRSASDDLFYLGANFQTPPFLAQASQIIGFAIDKVAFSFVSTQSPLNVQGKITTAFYQQAPNATFDRDADGLIDVNLSTLSSTDVLNSMNNAKVYQILQTIGKVTPIVKWVPQMIDAEKDLLQPADINKN